MKRHLYLGNRRFSLELRRLIDEPAERRSLRLALGEALPGGAIFWKGEEAASEEAAPVAARAPAPAAPTATPRAPAPEAPASGGSAAGPAGEAATFPDDIDAAAVARAKRKAARLGLPFCEECTKAKLARDRLSRAGGGGTPAAAPTRGQP